MSTYTDCMKPYMAGGGADRKLRFCTGAKLCSSKADNEETAKQICQSQPKKEPTTSAGGKAPSRSCTVSMATLAACAIRKINWDVITQPTFEEHLTQALRECSCRAKTPKTAPTQPIRTFANPSVPANAFNLPASPHWSRA